MVVLIQVKQQGKYKFANETDPQEFESSQAALLPKTRGTIKGAC
jgi:hypothetical protein